MVRQNKTKTKLKAGGVAFGVSVTPYEIGSVEIAGVLGFDYVIVDCEHDLCEERAVEETVRAADLHGLTPIVRMHNNPELILHALNSGAQGVLIARVNTVEDVRAILDAAKFHPEGRRTIYFRSRGGNFGTDVVPGETKQWGLDLNRETIIGCLIEEITGVKNLAKILAFREIDMVGLGDLDLAHSMGWPKQEEVDRLMDQCIEDFTKAGKAVFTTGNIDAMPRALARGFRMFTVSPRGYFQTGGAQFLRQAKEIARSNGFA